MEARRRVRFRWRPFNARAIMQEMNSIPFATEPIKLAYMWRDVERRAFQYGIPFTVSPSYPLKQFDLANRVAVLGSMEGWCPDYVRATYRRWFHDGEEAGGEPNLSESLIEIGQEPSRVISLAQSDRIGDAYQVATDEARRLNVFGLQPSSQEAKCSGVTSAWTMPWLGMRTASQSAAQVTSGDPAGLQADLAAAAPHTSSADTGPLLILHGGGPLGVYPRRHFPHPAKAASFMKVARSQGRHPLLGRCGHRCDPRSGRQPHRLRQDHARDVTERRNSLWRRPAPVEGVVNLSGGFSVPTRRFILLTSFSVTLAMV